MKVALTYGADRFEGLVDALSSAGHETVSAPLVAVKPRDACLYHRAAAALLELPWLLFPSRSTVEAWTSLGLPLGHGGRPLLGAVGPGTAAALSSAGGTVDLVAEPSTAAHLADAFFADPRAEGPVGLPHGDRALPTLRRALEQGGVEVRPLVVYDTVALPWDQSLEGANALVLASPSAVAQVPVNVGGSVCLIAVGPTTAAAIERRGWRCVEAASPTVAGVIEAITRAERADPSAGGPVDARTDERS